MIDANTPAPAKDPLGDHRAESGDTGVLARIGRVTDLILSGFVGIALTLSLGATLYQVCARYFFNSPVTWSEEVSRLAFLWVVFIGAAIATRMGTNIIRVDTLINLAPKRVQGIAGDLLNFLVAFGAIILVVVGYDLVDRTKSVSIALQWPVALFYAAGPVGGLFILIGMLRAQSTREGLVRMILATFAAAALYWAMFSANMIPIPDLNIGAVSTAIVIFLILVGVPVVFSIATGAVVGFWMSGIPITAMPHQWLNGVDSFLLLAIPFFLLAGHLMNEGGITRRLFALASILVGRFTGGLAHVNILASFMMGGMSGSSAGDVAATTKTLVPQMEEHGYDKAFSCAVTSTSSILANLLPPSILLMLYGSLAEASIGKLFMAGILPAIVLTISLMAIVHIISVKNGYKGDDTPVDRKRIMADARSALWAFPMPLIILGGIRFGITTPTEAAGVAAAYAFFVGTFIYGEIKLSSLPRIILTAALETSMIMMILGVSRPFSWVLTAEQIPQQLAAFMIGLSDNPSVILLIILAFLLLVGLVLESAPAIIILLPILLPVITSIGMDPIQFGVVMVLVTLTGSLTPPVGLLVYISAGIAGIPAMDVFRAALPLILAAIVALLIIAFVPAISMFLPGLLF